MMDPIEGAKVECSVWQDSQTIFELIKAENLHGSVVLSAMFDRELWAPNFEGPCRLAMLGLTMLYGR